MPAQATGAQQTLARGAGAAGGEAACKAACKAAGGWEVPRRLPHAQRVGASPTHWPGAPRGPGKAVGTQDREAADNTGADDE